MALGLGTALGIAGATSLLSGITNYLTGQHNMEKQAEMSKDLWQYQWDKAYSPQAQVRNLAAAGVNPGAQFGEHAALAGSPQMAMPSLPTTQFGITGLSDLANYIAAGAQAKKTGVEIPNIEADTRGKILDNQAQEFQNMLMNEFGLDKAAADVSLAWKQVQLAEDSHDMNLKEQALKDWSIAKEKALSECEETRRDILKKEFENKDTQIKLENEQRRASIGETQSRSALNRSAAILNEERVNTEKSIQGLNEVLSELRKIEKDSAKDMAPVKLQQELAKLDAIQTATILEKLRAEDMAAYSAFQRILTGHSQDGDITKIINAIHNIDNVSTVLPKITK